MKLDRNERLVKDRLKLFVNRLKSWYRFDTRLLD